MVLTRFGNKRRMISSLSEFFPDHKMRIELFFGAGGSFFYLPKPKYSILNDLDDDVCNLYLVIKNEKEFFYKEIERLPISEGLLNYWKVNKEVDPIMKAVRFIFLSNFSYLGKGDTLRVGLDNAKKVLLNNIEPTFKYLSDCKILNKDFRDVLSSISFTKGLNDKENAFCYMDPVYLDTECNYKVPKWKKEDSVDCLDIMVSSGIKTAMSEFNHPFIVEESIKRGLNVIDIGERANIKNRRVEVLITNYEISQQKLF